MWHNSAFTLPPHLITYDSNVGVQIIVVLELYRHVYLCQITTYFYLSCSNKEFYLKGSPSNGKIPSLPWRELHIIDMMFIQVMLLVCGPWIANVSNHCESEDERNNIYLTTMI